MSMRVMAAFAAGLFLCSALPAGAQPARQATPRPAAPGAAAPGPSSPGPSAPGPATPGSGAPATTAAPSPGGGPAAEQTTAVYGDWVLRCRRQGTGPQACELVQGVQKDGHPVAEMAVGRPGKNAPLQFTLFVPPFVSLLSGPTLSGGAGRGLDLVWNRCFPTGCVAAAPLSDDQLGRMRAGLEPMSVTLNDGNGRPVTLPLSPKGLTDALEALGKTDAG